MVSKREGAGRGDVLQSLVMRKSGDVIWGAILVGVVVTDAGTPLLPGLGLTLVVRESRNIVRRAILVSVGVPDIGAPLLPRLRLRRRLALAVRKFIAFEMRESRDRIGGGILARVVVSNVLTPLVPGFGFAFGLRESRDIVG